MTHLLEFIQVAMVGNPNSGKSTIFNNLTGARQHVGNYPGVTVQRYDGRCTYKGRKIAITDLPGTYSLTAYSEEERVTQEFLLAEKPDVVVNILDAANLQRNLYLTLLLKEMGVPLVLVFNMMDMARLRGYHFDLETLSAFFGAPIVEAVGSKNEGTQEILAAVVRVSEENDRKRAAGGAVTQTAVRYAENVEAVLAELAAALVPDVKNMGENAAEEETLRRWTAIELLEHDPGVTLRWNTPAVTEAIKVAEEKLRQETGTEPEVAVVAARYDVITGICEQAARTSVTFSRTASDKLDAVMTHRVWGIPIFLVMMYLLFQLTFTLGAPLMEWIEAGFAWLGEWINTAWGEAGQDSLLRSLIVDGIIGGVGGVIVFLPNILLLFFGIALLEDSGYMARAAFLMDRFMHKIGLHGKSFIPMLIGFGCTVPAIMATRTLSEKRERLATMFILPLMSCGARLPIYMLLIPAFFPTAWNAPVMWGLYVLGILLACVLAKILSVTVLRGEPVPFVIELPPYHVPTFRTVGVHALEQGWMYLKKAGTVILGISILLWAGTTFPRLPEESAAASVAEVDAHAEVPITGEAAETQEAEHAQEALEYSCMGRLGHAMEPVLRPMGADWKVGTALLGAIAAKEVFVAQLGIVYKLGGDVNEESEALRTAVQKDYSPLQGMCILLFCLISSPCMASFAVMGREAGWNWAVAQWCTLTVLAWGIAACVYQVGIGVGW